MFSTHLKTIEVALTQDYHVVEGKPLYEKRFHKVLKFHPPGLAPVKDQSGSYHIDVRGEQAYLHRYKDTFGFYDHIAAVRTDNGWCHINPNGEELYKERYDWCGNFQEDRCPVRNRNGCYFHILRNGDRLYKENYSYVGDFKDGIAVVYNNDAQSTHIDREGNYVHQYWYSQLDVFHKGLARAKDEKGWCHINLQGKPVYNERFASLEPFYNGQAHAETFYGDLIVINEVGEKVHTIQKTKKDFVGLLSADLVGFWKSETIKLAIELKLVDALPGSLKMISSRIEMPEINLQRLLKALWELDIIKQQDGIWILSETGNLLAPTNSSFLAAASVMWSETHKAWNSLKEKLYSSQIQRHLTFKESSNNDEELLLYRRALTGYALHDFRDIGQWIDWSQYPLVTALGQTAQTILPLILKSNPNSTGVLINNNCALYQESKSIHHDNRIQFLYQDPCKPWSINSDIVIFPRFLHYFPDKETLTILQQAYSSLKKSGVICIIEMFLDKIHPHGGLLDLNMLAESGGQLRNQETWKQLLQSAHFNYLEYRQLKPHLHMLVGRKDE